MKITGLINKAISEKYSDALYKTAYTKIVKKYQDMVYGFAYSITKDSFASQDIAQEVFIRAYNNLETLRNPDAFPGWIKQITRNECLKFLRQNKKYVNSLEVIKMQESHYNVEEEYEKKENKNQLKKALNKLPKSQRIPMVLYYIDGYSQKDIADFLKLKLNTVKKRLQRGRETFRKELAGVMKNIFDDVKPSRNNNFINKINLYTAFHTIAQSGQITVLEQMLVDGIDVNAIDAQGKTLLLWAVENKHIEAVKLLLKNGADMNIKDRNGISALDLARKRRMNPLLALFNEYKKVKK